MRALAVLAVAMLAACSNPPLSLQFELRGGPTGTCPSTACADIPMACDTMLFVRIVDPDHPDQFLESTCSQITPDGQADLCAIAGVQLVPPTDGELPARTLEVQVAVLPLKKDADGNLDCNSATADLKFDATGQPLMTKDSPPIAGRAYYHPGDSSTTVQLGCNDLGPINDGCASAMTVHIQPPVNEFRSFISVAPAAADGLTVSAGEPQPDGDAFELSASNKTVLGRSVQGPIPLWAGAVPTPVTSICVEVLEDGPSRTATLRCVPAIANQKTYSFAGVDLPASDLQKFVNAINALPQDPDHPFDLNDGVVIGLVLDNGGTGVPGLTVTADPQTAVKYFNEVNSSLDAPSTGQNGVFISTTAAFPTTWHAQQNATTTATAFGGLVTGLVTIVVLQFPENTGT